MARLRRRFKLEFLIATLLMAAIFISPGVANAGQITARKLTLSTSSAAGSAATTTYTFNFTVPSATVVKSAEAVICTTASGACSIPAGFSVSAGPATLASQPVNLGDASGWTVDTSTAGKLRLKKTGNVAAPGGAITVVFGNVQNPTTTNTTFFARINTYSADDWTTGAIDSGVVAASTATAISLTSAVNETLTFCTGTSGITSSSCAGATGSSIDLGTLSSSTVASGTSQMGITTNATSGYAITVNGATLTSGGDTITALAAQTASSTGSEQFGLNLKDNATPDVGAEVAGAGSGTATANYGTADSFRFVTGDSVASNATKDGFRLYTASYIANIATTTEPGTYTATMTYIATATF